jgi:acid phosphatase (class A)
MKASFFFFLVFILSVIANAQKVKEPVLVPARGHYKQLSMLDAAAKPGNKEIDDQKFPHDASTTEKRLGEKPYYLADVTLEDFRIPQPPANSSEQTRAELNYLLALQQNRTKAEVENSLSLAGIFYNVKVTAQDQNYAVYRRNLFHIGRSIGSWFNPDNLPLTADLIAKVWRDASYFIWSMKFKYLRIRPYKLEPALNNLEETNWAAYPSGHAANSYINAFIYQELAPEFTDVFIKDAYDMAHSREIIGVHYPSDSEASRIFARQFVNRLFKSRKFLADVDAVKEEWSLKAKESFKRPDMDSGSPQHTPPSCSPKPSECKTLE